jgi:hypothetical protein
MVAIGNCPNQSTRLTHPIYSADVASSDFLLFGHLEREMAGFTASCQEDTLSEIRAIFEEVPKGTLSAVYNQWITRVE